MVFKCQEDSFLREWTARVESCAQCQLPGGAQGYEVVLDDTILFPEGGGQPSDEGQISGSPVVRVERRGQQVLHYTLNPFQEGDTVLVTVDWERRFDHMQQHSGQHLLSAVLERELGVATTSWWLGATESHVEVAGAPAALRPLLASLQERCNTLIREALPVSASLRPPEQAGEAHTRGLPEDQRGGLLRVVSIAGVDENLCCGTHVSNLSQLQVLAVLGAEAGKKNKTNITFLVGGRVTARLQLCLERERSLTKLLKSEAAQHAPLVEKLQAGARTGARRTAALLEELAQLEAERALAGPGGPYLSLHRACASPDYLRSLARALQPLPATTLLMLSAGDEGGGPGGCVQLRGPARHIAHLGPQICQILKGKGAASGDRYQAKVTNMAAIDQCNRLLDDYFSAENIVPNGCQDQVSTAGTS